MALSNLDVSIGGLLVGTWMNSMLFILEALQVYRYFKTYTGDTRYFRAVIALLFSNDIFCTVAEYACVYLYCVTHWGDLTYLEKQYWPIFVQVFTTGLSASITQTFLVYRFWRLSHNSIIGVILLLLVLTAFGSSVAITIRMVTYSDFHQRSHLFLISTIWLVTGVITDVSIALALIWQFRRLNSYASKANTRAFIHGLVITTIKTGSATSIVVLVAFALYIVNTEANFSVGILFSLGRIYSLTMLFNLNARNRLHEEIGGNAFDPEQSDWLKTPSAARRGQQNEAHRMSVIRIVKTLNVEDVSALDRNLTVPSRSVSSHAMASSNVSASSPE